jgi:short-subunit dehydrogenase
MPEEAVRELVEINLLGPVWLIESVLPGMLRAGQGVIVNVASVVGFRASPYSAFYSATKHALVGLSHALRGELTGTGIKVCTVYPGPTRSEFHSSLEPPQGPIYPAEWVAGVIVRAVRFPRRDLILPPYRAAQLAEPLLGGVLDHALGEIRRHRAPHLGGSES